MNGFNQNQFNYNQQQNEHRQPLNQFTQSRPLNTQVDNPEIEYIQKTQRQSILFHLLSILLVFVASVVIHTYSQIIVFGVVGIWITTAVAVRLMPNEERQNIKKMKVWAIGHTSAGMAFDLIVTSLSLTNGGYGLDASALQFLNMMRLMIFIGTPVGYIGVTLKRLHHNWEVRNNEEKTASYMRKNTKKLF